MRDPALTLWPYARYLMIIAVFADIFIMPLALIAGALTARRLPMWRRVPVQAALYVSAAVTVVAFPFVLGYGRDPALPAALPVDYGRNLPIVLAAVWCVATVAAAVRRRRLRPCR